MREKSLIENDFLEDAASKATKDRRCFHCEALDTVSNDIMVSSCNVGRSVSMVWNTETENID